MREIRGLVPAILCKDLEIGEQLVGVLFGFDLRVVLEHFAVGADEVRVACDAHVLLAVHRLVNPDPEFRERRLVSGQQRERQVVLGAKLLVARRIVL